MVEISNHSSQRLFQKWKMAKNENLGENHMEISIVQINLYTIQVDLHNSVSSIDNKML